MDDDTGGAVDDTEARRRRDRQIYRVLRAELTAGKGRDDTLPSGAVGPRGPREQQYLDALGTYAFAVLRDKLTTGSIFVMARERGWPVADQGPLGDDVDEFVQEWLAATWEAFVSAIRRDQWDPELSGLPSWFVTLSVGRFGRLYRRRCDERRRHCSLGTDVDDVPVEDERGIEDFAAGLGRPERELIDRIVVRRQPVAEAAREMGMTESTARRAYAAALRGLRAGTGTGPDERGETNGARAHERSGRR